MSDTPETDDELNYNAFGFYTMGGLPTDAVCVDFARKLERERDDFEQRLFDVRDVLLDAMPDANAPTKILAEMIVAERDSNQRQADALVDLKKHTSIMDISHKIANDEYFKLAVENENLERERDLWKENSQSNRDEYYRLAAERDKFSKIIASFQDTIFDLRAERDELKCKLDESIADLKSRRELYKIQTEQLKNADLRVTRTKAYLEEIKSERDLWKLEAERWRGIR